MYHKNSHILTRLVFKASCISILIFLNLLGIANIVGVINVAFAVPTITNPNLQVQTVATGLNSPTSMAFIGPNDILVLEKNTGMVKRVKNGVVLSPPLLDFNVASNSERGLLGIAVIKTSSIHHYVFLYWTKASSTGTPLASQLIRYIFTNNPDLGSAQGRMSSPQILLNLPVTPGPNHNGGKVVISASGFVYAIIGDLNRNGKVQNFETGANADGSGGILRVTRDGGTVGSGILGSTHPLNKYFAYGIRNSFGLDSDPVSGLLWDTENGPASNDEINLIGPGLNSGWEDIMGMAPAGFNFNNLESFGGKGVYSNPEFVWQQVVAPTSIKFLNSPSLGTLYQNDMFVGDFNNGRIYNFNLNSQRNALALTGPLSDRIANTDAETQSVIFGEGFVGVSDLKVGIGDGYLYVLSIGNGAIYRIVPEAASTATFSDRNEGQTLIEEDDDLSPIQLGEDRGVTAAIDEETNDLNDDVQCKRLDERMDQIEEQEDRGSLNKEQAEELRQGVEAIENNLDCE